jgi:DNA-binding transcriptional ArsR family regulator
MAEWSFLTNHARALVCIAHDPGVRLRDIAAALDITERTAFGIVTDLTEAGYVVKDKDGRRNRYRIQDHLPLPEAVGRERTIGEVLGLLVDTRAPESAQLPDRNVASDGAPIRPKRPSRRDRKSPAPSPAPSDGRTRSQRAPDSAAGQDQG